MRSPRAPAWLPPHPPGLRVGLFGGSFNPPHAGHRHAALLALKRLRLDRVWWLVSPGNPLKDNAGLPPLATRVAAASRLAAHPRIAVTGLEASIGSRHTRDTLAWLQRHCPGVRFVWLMGADSLVSFHRWRDWRAIAACVPIAVIDRPGTTLAAKASRAARAFRAFRLRESAAPGLASRRPPAFVYLHGPRVAISSTQLRGGEPAAQAARMSSPRH